MRHCPYHTAYTRNPLTAYTYHPPPSLHTRASPLTAYTYHPPHGTHQRSPTMERGYTRGTWPIPGHCALHSGTGTLSVHQHWDGVTPQTHTLGRGCTTHKSSLHTPSTLRTTWTSIPPHRTHLPPHRTDLPPQHRIVTNNGTGINHVGVGHHRAPCPRRPPSTTPTHHGGLHRDSHVHHVTSSIAEGVPYVRMIPPHFTVAGLFTDGLLSFLLTARPPTRPFRRFVSPSLFPYDVPPSPAPASKCLVYLQTQGSG